MSVSKDWETRIADLWLTFADKTDPDTFVAAIDALAAEQPASGAAAFERACARDSTGRRAVIQMASSLRNLGHADRSVTLPTEEGDRTSDHLDDAVSATLALALADAHREREAVSIADARLLIHPDEPS